MATQEEVIAAAETVSQWEEHPKFYGFRMRQVEKGNFILQLWFEDEVPSDLPSHADNGVEIEGIAAELYICSPSAAKTSSAFMDERYSTRPLRARYMRVVCTLLRLHCPWHCRCKKCRESK
jgi:hypothetical protein